MKKLLFLLPILLIACNYKSDSEVELARLKDSITKVNTAVQLKSVRDSINESLLFEKEKLLIEENAKRIADSISAPIQAAMNRR